MGGIRRREFMTVVGGAAVTWPVAAPAQPKVPVVGWLSAQAARGRFSETFVEGLKDSGFVEGRNVIIENRFADGRNDRLPALAAELVQRGVSVIAAPLAAATLAAKGATSTIPIVFLIGSDPVELGLVKSLNQPGGNLTGVAYLNVEIAAKRLELLHK